MQRTIRIEALGDLAAHGYGLNATCERWRRRTDLDILALIERFWPDFLYVGRRIDDMLLCTTCGAREATVQIPQLLVRSIAVRRWPIRTPATLTPRCPAIHATSS
jgi:hypothetical protein